MESGNYFMSKFKFCVARVHTLSHRFFQSVDIVERSEAQDFEIPPHQIVRDRHEFAEHFAWCVGNTDVIAQRFGHFLYTVQTLEKRCCHDDLGLLPKFLLQLPSYEQIELLVGPSQLNVSLQCNRVISLNQRIEKLMD